MNETNGKPTEFEKWPTARAVAVQLGCSRQQVYKLAERGKLLGRDVREKGGGKVKRFDPSSVAELANADNDLDLLLASEAMTDEDDEDDDGPPPNVMVLAGKVVSEARQQAADARKGQHEAYDLIARPTQELVKLLQSMLTEARERIRELETTLNAIFDANRERRREDLEAEFLQSRLKREDDRKDAFFQMFINNLPLVLDQLKASSMGSGPFVPWLKKLSPEKQTKLITAIEAVTADDEVPETETSAAAEVAASTPGERQAEKGTDAHPP